MKRPVILLFTTDGALDSDAVKIKALIEMHGGVVQVRNADYAVDRLERCDGVAGKVPDIYSGYPSAQEKVEEYQQFLTTLAGGVQKTVVNTGTTAAGDKGAKTAEDIAKERPPQNSPKPKPGAGSGWKPQG